MRTFDDWCADLWDQFIGKPKPRTRRDKRGKSFVDFSAVRSGVLQTLRANAGLGASASRPKPTFDFVLVDEGQDLDATAYGILNLTTKHLTVFAGARQQIFEGGASVQEMQKHLSLGAGRC